MPLLFADELFLEHETGRHPESADRLRAVYARLNDTGLIDRFDRGDIRPATTAQLARLHDEQYVEFIERFAADGGGRIESDTAVSPRSYDVSVRAAGCAVAAADAVLAGGHRQAVCLTRPPGHHALPAGAMGFCLFNNVAIAAAHAVAAHGLDHVLIVDWDVHHGNGTQDMFERDGQVYFFSAHRWPFYPGTGAAGETGTGAGRGTIFNLPLEFGASRGEYLERFHTMLSDAAARCRPDLILVSAGFDAHALDPIGSLGLESEDFRDLTNLVLDAAGAYCDGRLVSLLEGGYNVDMLAESVDVHLRTLLEREEARDG